MARFTRKSGRVFAEVKEVERDLHMDQLLSEEESLKDRLAVVQALIAEGVKVGVPEEAPVPLDPVDMGVEPLPEPK